MKIHVLFVLSSINQTDQMLVHLQSFNSMPENYMIPESTKNGVPLFYIPPGSTTPVSLVAILHTMLGTYQLLSSVLVQGLKTLCVTKCCFCVVAFFLGKLSSRMLLNPADL